MEQSNSKDKKSLFPSVYEVMVWVFYVGMFKYSYYLDLYNHHQYDLSVWIYTFTLTLYWILFYRWILPKLFLRNKLKFFIPFALLFMLILSIPNNYLVVYIFEKLTSNGSSQNKFYLKQLSFYTYRLHRFLGWDFEMVFPDVLVFSSVAFIKNAIATEFKKRALQADNYTLQIQALKAQLDPHFLFNTFNSIYGMSLLENAETPNYILKMSDMLRYLLYESGDKKVLLTNEIEFIDNYFAIENIRYPSMRFKKSCIGSLENIQIYPFLFLTFAENVVKHGQIENVDECPIEYSISFMDNVLDYIVKNKTNASLGIVDISSNSGVGLKNLQSRLELYYPDNYSLDCYTENGYYISKLKIIINDD